MNDQDVFNRIKEIANHENQIENPEINLEYSNVMKREKRNGDIFELIICGRGERDISIIISLLKELKSLTRLHIAGKVIKGVEYLKDLKKLKTLELLPDYPIDILPVSEMNHLTELELHRIPLESEEDDAMADISPLRKLTRLRKLSLVLLGLTDITPLRYLPGLEQLDIGANNISDISVLKHLTKIKDLDLTINCIDDISALRGLQNLVNLKACENYIKDISVLKYIGSIKSLEMENNQIEDISALRDLKKLEYLVLSNNHISNIDPLAELNKLCEVYLDYNKIKDFSPIRHIYLMKYHDIEIKNNPGVVPPASIIKKGDEAVVKYFKEMLKAEKQLIRQVNKKLIGN